MGSIQESESRLQGKRGMIMIKVLNLYAGIGGNRKLWENVEVIAIERDRKIASIYSDFFPNDKVIITDAHRYLLEHYTEFDFIWSSPPCPSHSRLRKNSFNMVYGKINAVYPDMRLYQEILLLKYYFKGKYCVENVISFYNPLIKSQQIQRHCFWANFYIPSIELENDNIAYGTIDFWQRKFGFDLFRYSNINKSLLLSNCVEPKLGKHIFDCAFKVKQERLNEVL